MKAMLLLLMRLTKSQIDIAVVIGHEDRANAQKVGQLDLV